MTAVLDEGAFAALARDEGPLLVRAARRFTRSQEEAEDVVQEAFLRAWRGRDRYRGDAPPAAWLRRIVHNVAVERARRAPREVVVEEIEERWRDDAYTVDASVVAERAATRAELEDALVHLPAIYRAAVLLHDVEGWTVGEIADAQGVGPDTAKMRLRRGRMALVSSLAEGAERRAALDGVPLSCWEARRHVSDYLDGQVDGALARALEAHLGGCPTCPPLYTSLVGAKASLGHLRDRDDVVPDGVAGRIQERLGQEQPGGRPV